VSTRVYHDLRLHLPQHHHSLGPTRSCFVFCVLIKPHDPPHPCSPTVQRDGCPKIVNLGTSKTDLFYERKK
jgi:hypothetical protein